MDPLIGLWEGTFEPVQNAQRIILRAKLYVVESKDRVLDAIFLYEGFKLLKDERQYSGVDQLDGSASPCLNYETLRWTPRFRNRLHKIDEDADDAFMGTEEEVQERPDYKWVCDIDRTWAHMTVQVSGEQSVGFCGQLSKR
jgi:hypothetical protein